MSLIAQQRRHLRTRQLNVRVSPDVMDTLTDYRRFIQSCRNYLAAESKHLLPELDTAFMGSRSRRIARRPEVSSGLCGSS
jgi:hypothetical protein